MISRWIGVLYTENFPKGVIVLSKHIYRMKVRIGLWQNLKFEINNKETGPQLNGDLFQLKYELTCDYTP